jgi:hypothetical protein
LFCEDFIEDKILLLLQFINRSHFNDIENRLPHFRKIYSDELGHHKTKFGFYQQISPFRYENNLEEAFINKIKVVFDNINSFLQEDNNNAFTLDLILDATKSLDILQDSKQAMLPCFSIIERTLITDSFRNELNKIEPFALHLFRAAETSTTEYLKDIMTLRSKLIHGDYNAFYKTLRKIHRKYFNSGTWDSYEYSSLNWCLNFVIGDITMICRNILYQKFVNNSLTFAKK